MTQTYYPTPDANPNFAALEEEILKFWESENVFARSVANRDEANAYVFYDGPPFANGLPHYGHLLTGFVKDAVARYQTMRGKRVERRFGWDCHGLPAEMGAEKELGISGRAAITEFGIDKFNEHCRTSVMKYTADWEYYVNRQGRWVDFKNDYKTMDKSFMESCLWAFKELYNKGLIYESMRVMPYSWAAETPVSNFETRIDNATREREDKAAFVKFKLKDPPRLASPANNYYFIAWTTTPWTLPSNLALAINPELKYSELFTPDGDCYYGSLSGIKKLFPKADECPGGWTGGKSYEEVSKQIKDEAEGFILVEYLTPQDFIGLTYEPLFPFFADTPNAFRVLDGGDAVTDGEGTGIVHMAPGFGEVDQKICAENGIEVIVPVDEKGRYTDAIDDIPFRHSGAGRNPSQENGENIDMDTGLRRYDELLRLSGLNVIADTRIEESDLQGLDPRKHDKFKEHVAKYGLANMRILRWLDENGMLVKQEEIKHNYPHCWRTDTPLIYRAMSSWYVDVQKIKANMAANNLTIRWIPDHVQAGQMGRGIESAPDWSISRNRFWGTPIPIWKSASGKIHVCGSIEEIERLSGQKVEDLHRPYIDNIVLKIDGEEYTRIEDVFDCWFESGSMPFAQLHYPFENKELFERTFPADFITEYIAQTRGWFYTLQVLSAALFGKAPFQNCICHGVVIDEETGLKYSKRLKNYKDPKEVMDAYGADALRWMMLSSPVMRGADLSVDPEGKFIRDVVRLNIKPIWNAYNFFTLYANADGIQASIIDHRSSIIDVLDRYILAKCKAAVEQVKTSLDAYDTPGACEAISGFFEVLNNWYIRRSKDRFWAEEKSDDKRAAYDTLFTVLNAMCKATAPLLPFTTEAIYRGLNNGESVHLQDFPEMESVFAFLDKNENETTALTSSYQFKLMDVVRDACTAALSVRSVNKIRVRQPLSELRIVSKKAAGVVADKKIVELIQDEVNVQKVVWEEDIQRYATLKLQINSAVLGKRLPEKMKQILPASKKGEWKQLEDGSVEIAGEVLKSDEYSINLEPKPEYKDSAAPLSTNDALVILDLTITPELEAEGIARDMVRMIQQARKDAGLNVSDRITLSLKAPETVAKAVEAHREYISAQTLANSITEGDAPAAAFASTQEMDGAQVVIGVSKV